MWKNIVFLVLQILVLSSWQPAQAATPDALKQVGSTGMPFTLVSGRFAVWSGGAFVAVQDRFSGAPLLQIFDRNGTEVARFMFTIHGASLINIYDHSVALGLDGSVAIVGTAYTGDSKGGMFVAWVSPDRQEQTIIRTSPFFPHTVTIASDGTIWVAGDETKPLRVAGDETKPHREKPDYTQHLIRRYEKTGRLLGSFIPWSSVGTGPSTISPTPSVRSILLSLKDRVAWYSPGSSTYIEFSSDGSIINRYETAPHQKQDVISVALCDDGGLFAATRILGGVDQDQTNWGIFTFDRQRSEWSLIQRNEKWGMLFGCDGTRLATATDFKTISWLQSPQMK
jgi:hypothetical protein